MGREFETKFGKLGEKSNKEISHNNLIAIILLAVWWQKAGNLRCLKKASICLLVANRLNVNGQVVMEILSNTVPQQSGCLQFSLQSPCR